MDESVFGAGFDLQDYIHKRSLDIQDLRERALYRQVTDTLMVNLFQYLGDEQKKPVSYTHLTLPTIRLV